MGILRREPKQLSSHFGEQRDYSRLARLRLLESGCPAPAVTDKQPIFLDVSGTEGEYFSGPQTTRRSNQRSYACALIFPLSLEQLTGVEVRAIFSRCPSIL